MRIYNGTKTSIDLPLTLDQILTIGSHSVSKDFMPSNAFLSLIASAYDEKELALIVSGPYELNMCASMPVLAPMIVQTLDQAVERFLGDNKVQEQEHAVIIENAKSAVVEKNVVNEDKVDVIEEEGPSAVDNKEEEQPIEEKKAKRRRPTR